MCHPIFISYLYFQAQKQIFNLMKFDSYPRFLKSDLYKQCLSGNVEYPSLEVGLLIHPASNTPTKLKKSLSNAEDRRRKSLLPWHRKNRSKSKDRGETEYNSQRSDEPVTNNSNKSVSNAHSSQSSLTSLDLAMSCSMHVSLSSYLRRYLKFVYRNKLNILFYAITKNLVNFYFLVPILSQF